MACTSSSKSGGIEGGRLDGFKLIIRTYKKNQANEFKLIRSLRTQSKQVLAEETGVSIL
jgi:hypothetical protein